MKVSIVIAILDSHEIVRRQVLHFRKMDLSDDVEFIFVDDGSDPPLEISGLKNLTVHKTNDFRPWTQPLARNAGAKISKGKYLLCTDIDHVLSKDLIEKVCNFTGDVMRFTREFGILDENGGFTQDPEIIGKYGATTPEKKRLRGHGNSYAIKRDLFLRLGGSRQRDVYPNRDEVRMKQSLKILQNNGEISILEHGATIYMIPNGRYCGDVDSNPFGLFHNLSRKR